MTTQRINGFQAPELRTSGAYRFFTIAPQIRRSFSTWFYRLSSLGIREDQKSSEIKRTRLTNRMAIFGAFSSMVQLPVFMYLHLTTSILSILLTNALMCGVLLLNFYSRHSQAKTLFFLTVDLILVFASGYLGKESGLYLYFFGLIILPFILFDLQEKFRIVFFILVTLASVYIIEFADLSLLADKTIANEIRRFVFLSSVTTGLLSIVFSVYSLVKENAASEKKLEENQTLFSGLLDATPDPTIITDKEGFITLCNTQTEKVFGFMTEDLLGKHISMLVPSRLHGQMDKYFTAKGASKKVKDLSEYLYVAKKDGTEFAVELSQNTYMAKSGTMTIHVIRDMTERNKHEQELMQFSYVVSHDLKAPLRAIFKLSEWVEEEIGNAVSDNARKNLQLLRGRVSRMEGLINGLLEYAKIGRVNIRKEKTNTNTVINEVVDMLAPPGNIQINVQSELPVFETAKTPFQQVFFNLLANAIKFNDKAMGKIDITACTKGQFYEFTVEDNGIGIDPLYHEKVFVIFQTLEARDKVEGTGIGLTIIKKSVEDLGGKVSLYSTPGEGSKFTFTWPQHLN